MNICLSCQWRLLAQRPIYRSRARIAVSRASQPPRRTFQAVTNLFQNIASTASTTSAFDPTLIPRPQNVELRNHLAQWQQQHSGPTDEVLSAFENYPAHRDVQNGLSKLSSGFKTGADIDVEDRNTTAEDENDDLITIGLFLKPGDVVELSQQGREPVLAVFTQQLDGHCQFFSVNGRWCHSTIRQVAFVISGCIDPTLLTPMLPFLPTSPGKADPKGELHVPINLAAPVQRLLERMTEDAEHIYRANASVLDTAYSLLADSTRVRMMTLAQIAKTLLTENDTAWKPSPAALLAVRKSLNHNEFRFRSDKRSHRLTNVFAIRPKNDVQLVESVHEWIREHREHLADLAKNKHAKPTIGATYIANFVASARKLIFESRKDRDPNFGTIGPSKTRLSKQEESSGVHFTWGNLWTGAERQILGFMQAWVLTGQFIGMDGLHSACANLIMATGCYDRGTIQNSGLSDAEASEIRRITGMLFLQELGVITPYENRAFYDEQLMLPTVRFSRNLELLNAKAETTRKTPDFRDSMSGLRRDWGSTLVYCIDDAGAQEIDDGVSIERVDEHASEYWIHVHVANPTAFFDKTHTLSGLAAHLTETVYTPEKTFPMLPSWATQEYFSLKADRPVLTFSSRINASGKVLETKIQPGIVRNVVTITPSDVCSLLGNDTPHDIQELIVGGKVSIQQTPQLKSEISPRNIQDLQDLYMAAQALWEARKAAGAIRMAYTGNQVRVFQSPSQPGITWTPPSADQIRFTHGDPIIELTNQVPRNLVHFGIGPENIVEEMMILACSTAASWCTERNIPVMYRGTIEPPGNDAMSPEEIKTRLMLPYLEKHSEVPRGLALRYLSSLGRAIAHYAPLPHKIIGVTGYVKVTSPLRRFSDMLAHWQIEAALRYEAQTGRKFDSAKATPGPRGILPFTQRQMRESIVTLSPRERIISTTKRSSTRFWTCLALLRAHYYKEASLPRVFRFWVRSTPDETRFHATGAQGLLPDYGFQANFIDQTEVQLGDEWEVQLERIDIFLRHIYVRPIRLLHREAEVL
ncbi:hypothetical protein GQ44DRAFT_619537 [Phaeosphaeriaceae sp. PMI808]|nr:hypothetical protein GQ44DRAFT_619537 [Phaeosphaeriaceae sp. PMI808]